MSTSKTVNQNQSNKNIHFAYKSFILDVFSLLLLVVYSCNSEDCINL